ncbi:hypothetical protein GOP47_0024769 [Adiantum capillus-veneris]|uniref:Uncharacterized protein n=1 Tax=Adiantum capillus-veneris TaxID=13818 RepID=A0A9D4U2E4_ADICA|nr:hypothetical protein GOP47_0024769 [Adiantum capillus-veneris]
MDSSKREGSRGGYGSWCLNGISFEPPWHVTLFHRKGAVPSSSNEEVQHPCIGIAESLVTWNLSAQGQ